MRGKAERSTRGVSKYAADPRARSSSVDPKACGSEAKKLGLRAAMGAPGVDPHPYVRVRFSVPGAAAMNELAS